MIDINILFYHYCLQAKSQSKSRILYEIHCKQLISMHYAK